MNSRLLTGRQRGAALVIALTASSVVLLSAALLFGYLRSMLDDQQELELLAQARLSQESAADRLERLLAGTGVSEGPVEVEVGGVVTSLEQLSEVQSPPGLVRLGIAADGAAAPAFPGVSVAERSSDTLFVRVLPLAGMPSPPSTGSFRIPCGQGTFLLAGWRGQPAEGGPLFAVAVGDRLGCSVYGMEPPDRAISVGGVPFPLVPGTLASLDSVGGHACVLLASEGRGALVDLEEGSVTLVPSPPGSCPAVLAGGVWPGGDFVEDPALRHGEIVDVLRVDIDSDGREDMVWISDSSAAALFSSTGILFSDRLPGRSPGAWGVLPQTGGLGVRWDAPDGSSAWRRLAWGGFQDCLSFGPLLRNWSGRIVSGAGGLAGMLGGSLALLDPLTGSVTDIGGQVISWTDIDGGGDDALVAEEEGLSLSLNPAAGPDLTQVWSAVSTRDGRVVLSRRLEVAMRRGADGALRPEEMEWIEG
jgi:hypothetical protein